MELQCLPNEVKILIFCLLDPNERLIVARTCRNLFDIIEPIMYTTFVEYNRDSIPLLLIKLFRNPEIGKRFKRIYTSERDLEKFPTGPNHFNRFGHQVNERLFIDQVPDYNLGDLIMNHYYYDQKDLLGVPNWDMEDVSLLGLDDWSNNWATINAFLLLLLPNLEGLSMKDLLFIEDEQYKPTCDVIRIAGQLQRSHPRSPHSYSKLSEISISSGMEITWGDSIEWFLSLFQLPSLKILELTNMNGTPLQPGIIIQDICLQNLHLTKCAMSTEDISRILTRCCSLEKLYLEVDCRAYSYGAPVRNGQFKSSVFFYSILHLQDRLQTLTVLDKDPTRLWKQGDKEGDRDRNANEDLDLDPVPSLAGFHKLRELHISSQFLFGKRVLENLQSTTTSTITATAVISNNPTGPFTLADLPASLEYLTVRESSMDFILPLLAELTNYTSPYTSSSTFSHTNLILPKLKHLECHFTNESDASTMLNGGMCESLCAQLSARGTKFWFKFGEGVREEEWREMVKGKEGSFVLVREGLWWGEGGGWVVGSSGGVELSLS